MMRGVVISYTLLWIMASCTVQPVYASPVPSSQEIMDVIEAFIVKAAGEPAVFIINEIMIIDEKKHPDDAGEVIVDVTIIDSRYLLAIRDKTIVAAQKLSNLPEGKCQPEKEELT